MGRTVQGWFYKLRRTHEGNSLSRHVTKAWSKRYFVIVRDRINWYKNADPYSGEKPSGFINFQEVLRIRVLHSESRLEDQFNRDEYGTYSLEIVANSRRLTIRTPSRDEAMIWTYELRKKMKVWTDRTGVETLREVALQRKTVDSRDGLIARIDKALETAIIDIAKSRRRPETKKNSHDMDGSGSSVSSTESTSASRRKQSSSRKRHDGKRARRADRDKTKAESKVTEEAGPSSPSSEESSRKSSSVRRSKSKSSSSGKQETKTSSRRRDQKRSSSSSRSASKSRCAPSCTDEEDEKPIQLAKRSSSQRSKSRRSERAKTAASTPTEGDDNIDRKARSRRQVVARSQPAASINARDGNVDKLTMCDIPEYDVTDNFLGRAARGRNSEEGKTMESDSRHTSFAKRSNKLASSIPVATQHGDIAEDWLEESL